MTVESLNGATTTALECRICGTVRGHQQFVLRESMFQTWEEFHYFLCASCGCLQIVTVPVDLARHYPTNYYSLGETPTHSIRKRMKVAVLRHVGGNRSLMGAILNALGIRPNDAIWLESAGIKAPSRILDVGSGSGERLRELSRAGFVHLSGVDPHIASDRVLEGGITLHKAELAQMTGPFDLIMFHHSLEHMADPRTTVRHAARLLAPEGLILVRVPVMGRWAWRHYQADWVQLDPPRHLYTFSETALDRVAQAGNLRVVKTVYDSTSLQFEGSERILRMKPAGTGTAPADMSKAEMKRRTARLNLNRDGDQACFFLAHDPDRSGNSLPVQIATR